MAAPNSLVAQMAAQLAPQARQTPAAPGPPQIVASRNPDTTLISAIGAWLRVAQGRPGYPIIAAKLRSVVQDLTAGGPGPGPGGPGPQGPPGVGP